jgi:transcription elongation factor Elf1
MADKVQDDSVVGRVDRFLLSKKAKFTCSSCGSDEWWAMDVAGLEGSVMRGRFPVYTLACRNCGLIRQHLKAVVDEELPGQKEE